jgi:hypothetical protein
LIDEENGPTLAYAVQNHFAALAIREGPFFLHMISIFNARFFLHFLQLIDEENGPTLAYAVQNHFAALAMREGRTRKSSVHHQSLVTLSRK